MPWRTGNGTRSMIKNTWLSLSLVCNGSVDP